MPDKVCCTTWVELAPELQAAKEAELQKHIDSGLPRSMFAALLRTLSTMNNFCPCCGGALVEGVVPPSAVPVKRQAEEVKPAPAIKRIKCGTCDGRGTMSASMKRTDPDAILCVVCQGRGTKNAKQDGCVDGGDMGLIGVTKSE